MDIKLVLELYNHNVYYVKTQAISYYITIPKNINMTSICIELKSKMSNYDIELNDEVWVLENVKNTFSYIDNYNITLVLPIIKENQIGILEKIDDTRYEEIDKLIGFVINNSYKLLKNNNIQVSNEIVLVNNDRYKSFINWFTSKYKNRVICKNLLEIIQLFNANATSYKKLETPVMTFVVGSYSTEVNAPKIEQKSQDITPEPKKGLQFSYGYANYWLLAITTIIVSSVIAIITFTAK